MVENKKTFNVGDEVYSTLYEVYGKVKRVHTSPEGTVIYYVVESDWGEFTNPSQELIDAGDNESGESEVL